MDCARCGSYGEEWLEDDGRGSLFLAGRLQCREAGHASLDVTYPTGRVRMTKLHGLKGFSNLNDAASYHSWQPFS